MASSVKFLAFSDFHYKKGMYAPSIEHANAVFKRAKDEGAELVIHAGDLCNSYRGSPELLRAVLDNEYGLPFINVTGNHELEDDSLDYVKPRLSNLGDINFAREDAAYYYVDRCGFRFIGLDTNFSLNPESGVWMRNTRLAKPRENIKGDSLGKEQLIWLREILLDAAEKALPTIIIGHAGFSGVWNSSPDHAEVREIYKEVNAIRRGTVLLSINGHYHTNRAKIIDEVLFLDLNTTINGHWQSLAVPHYTGEHTYRYTNYDENGLPTETYDRPLSELTMAPKTWFFKDPLSAIITVSDDGVILVRGMETDWVYGIAPETPAEATMPEISSGRYELFG